MYICKWVLNTTEQGRLWDFSVIVFFWFYIHDCLYLHDWLYMYIRVWFQDLTSVQNLQKKHALVEADVGAHQVCHPRYPRYPQYCILRPQYNKFSTSCDNRMKKNDNSHYPVSRIAVHFCCVVSHFIFHLLHCGCMLCRYIVSVRQLSYRVLD